MRITDGTGPDGGVQAGAAANFKDIVMGLHWDPPHGDARADPADLDALCVLFDAQDRVLEVVDPHSPRSANGSVVHTGDSRDGASHWDDERIFVFLEAMPEAVQRIEFFVASATRHAFHEIRGARCHVSDQASEHEWLRLDLTVLEGRRSHAVAALQRGAEGWTIIAGAVAPDDERLAGLRRLSNRPQ